MAKQTGEVTAVALSLMQTNKTVKERATQYFHSIARNLQKEVLDPLIEEREKIEQRLFDLKDFTLDTNLNAGQSRMTVEDCQRRFKDIIDLEYKLTLIDLELKVKTQSYARLFSVSAE